MPSVQSLDFPHALEKNEADRLLYQIRREGVCDLTDSNQDSALLDLQYVLCDLAQSHNFQESFSLAVP